MAINQNVLLLGAYPMAVSLWFLWIVQVWKQRDLFAIFRPYSRVLVSAGFFVLIGFTIVRNMIPSLEWGSGA